MLNREKLLIVGDEPVVRSMTTAQGPAPRVRNQAVSTASSGARTSRVQHSTETFRSAFEIPVKIQLANGKSLDVSLCRVSDGLFLLAATAWVRRGQSVQVLMRGRRIDSEVIYCKYEADGSFRVALAVGDRHSELFGTDKRLPVNIAASIIVGQRHFPVDATVIDISGSGLGLIADAEIEVGALACVDTGAGLAFGEVRYCKKVDKGYRLGLRMEESIVCDKNDRTGLSKCVERARTVLGRRKRETGSAVRVARGC